MNQKLYYKAYKFLKIRATRGGLEPFKAIENLTITEKQTIIKFLSYNHGVKFI
jgi:hypothetical protein